MEADAAMTAACVHNIALSDGRQLAWAEYGDGGGAPVIYMHGTPSSHLEPWAFRVDEAAQRAGLRLIAPDRPGMGGSDFQRRRRILDWPADLAALADHLDLEQFSVLGYSGGVPFATAVAFALPERVQRLTLVACVAHLAPALEEGLHRNGLQLKRLARARPRLARVVMSLGMGLPSLYPSLLVKMVGAGLPEVDRAVLDDQRIREGFPGAIRCAFRRGASGPQVDEALMSAEWGFDPAEIRVTTMLWQGTLDTFGARPAMAEHLHRAILGSELHLSHDGHLSVLTKHLDEILDGLT